MATEIVVSLVGGGFAVVVALISKIGHDNKKDHGIVHQSLGRIEQKIDGHVERSQIKTKQCLPVTHDRLLARLWLCTRQAQQTQPTMPKALLQRSSRQLCVG
jgi:hypothetical protein